MMQFERGCADQCGCALVLREFDAQRLGRCGNRLLPLHVAAHAGRHGIEARLFGLGKLAGQVARNRLAHDERFDHADVLLISQQALGPGRLIEIERLRVVAGESVGFGHGAARVFKRARLLLRGLVDSAARTAAAAAALVRELLVQVGDALLIGRIRLHVIGGPFDEILGHLQELGGQLALRGHLLVELGQVSGVVGESVNGILCLVVGDHDTVRPSRDGLLVFLRLLLERSARTALVAVDDPARQRIKHLKRCRQRGPKRSTFGEQDCRHRAGVEPVERNSHRVDCACNSDHPARHRRRRPAGPINLGNEVQHRVSEHRHRLADGRLGARELRVDGLRRLLQRNNHALGGQFAILAHLTQRADPDAKPIGQRTSNARGLLHDGVQFLATQGARRQALRQLNHRGLRGLRRTAADGDGFRQRFGHAQQPVLADAEITGCARDLRVGLRKPGHLDARG